MIKTTSVCSDLKFKVLLDPPDAMLFFLIYEDCRIETNDFVCACETCLGGITGTLRLLWHSPELPKACSVNYMDYKVRDSLCINLRANYRIGNMACLR